MRDEAFDDEPCAYECRVYELQLESLEDICFCIEVYRKDDNKFLGTENITDNFIDYITNKS